MVNHSSKVLGIGLTSLEVRQKLVEQLKKQGITNTTVLEMIKNIPRHLFVETALSNRAYENISLPIGYSQTIFR